MKILTPACVAFFWTQGCASIARAIFGVDTDSTAARWAGLVLFVIGFVWFSNRYKVNERV